MNSIRKIVREIVEKELNKINCPVLNISKEIENEVNEFNTDEDFLRGGGLSVESLDRLAFGFTAEDIKTLTPNQLNIKWKEDLDNVKFEQEKSGLSKIEWAKKINISEPIDVSYEKNKFYIEDGHHRYYAAKILNLPLNVSLQIKQNPVVKISDLGYDDLMRCIFKQTKSKSKNSSTLNELKDKWDINKIEYYRKFLKQNPIKFKYALGILDIIEKSDGKVSDKQKIMIDKAMRGESGNINFSTKN